MSRVISYLSAQCVNKMSPFCDVIAIGIGHLHLPKVLIGSLSLVCCVSKSLSGQRSINILIKPIPAHLAGKHEV